MKKIFIVIVLLTVISNYSMATTEDNLHCMGHRTKRILRIERKEYQTY